MNNSRWLTGSSRIRRPWIALVLLLLLAPSSGSQEPVVISEFMATNTRTLEDERGGTPDWIELHNRGTNATTLSGYSLTDNPARPRKWLLPTLSLPPGGRLLIHASGRDQRDPAKPMHAPFKLSGDGEYLALVTPDGRVASEFTPTYPPQLPDVSYGYATDRATNAWFLPRATPGKPNLPAGTRQGPILKDPTHTPVTPGSGEPIRVSIRILPGDSSLKSVTALHRFEYQPEKLLALNDSGRDGDAVASDSVWTGTLVTTGAPDGSMLRWRFVATDNSGVTLRWPLNRDPMGSARYLGTVVRPDSVTSALPTFHLFIEPSLLERADSEEGAPACFFFDGEFYDNIHVKVRGNTTAHFPKKSHRLEFNSEHRFRHPGPGGRIRNTSLMAEWGDPTYLRQHLSFWLMTQSGTPAPFHDPVRVQLNGRFYQLAMHSQVLGEELLERVGLDPDGALYKAVGVVTPDHNSTGGFEKKTRRHEGENDYVEFARALSDPRLAGSRATAIFDRCDLPAVINYIAVARLTQEDDDIWANLSLYRDSEGSGRWRPIAFDMNVSWGLSFGAGGILANADEFRSHPLWGAAGIGNSQGHNRLYDAIIRTPATREMLLRRMRTLMDQFLQPPSTLLSERVLENHLEEMRRRMAPEAVLDRALWGTSWNAPRGSSPARALALGIQALNQQFIEPRRVHFYVTHAATNTARRIGIGTRLSAGIPGLQPTNCVARIAEVGLGETRNQDWLRLTHTNTIALEVSGWSLGGDVDFTLPPGTVLPAGQECLVASSLTGFQARTASPKAGEQRLVVGGFKGNLEKAREIRLTNAHRQLVDRWQRLP